MKNKNNSKLKTVKDILKVCHKISRDIELSTEIGWKTKTRVHQQLIKYYTKLHKVI